MKKLFLTLAFLALSNALWALQSKDLINLHKNKTNANFTLIKKLKGFEKPLVSLGEFSIKDNELYYIVTSPINSVMKINKEGIFYEDKGVFKKSEGNYDKGFFLALINLDFEELEKNFNINLSGDEKKWQVLLEPKNMWLKKIFTHIIIKGGVNVECIELLEINGDHSAYELQYK